MASETMDTKQALIEAAGELFADYGFARTTIRDIAQKAGANIAAIHYHFGGKENLYTEVLRHILLQSEVCTARQLLAEGECFKTPEGMAAAVCRLIHEHFEAFFPLDEPEWWTRLVMRSLLEPTPQLEEVLRQVMLPEHAAKVEILRRFNPSMTEKDAQMWALSLDSQIVIYIFAKYPILMALEMEQYSREFLREAERQACRVMLGALGLPLPG